MTKIGDGSRLGGRKIIDGTVAGVATRTTDEPPQDSDWPEGAPPDGTTVWEGNHTQWVRLGGIWYGRMMSWDYPAV